MDITRVVVTLWMVGALLAGLGVTVGAPLHIRSQQKGVFIGAVVIIGLLWPVFAVRWLARRLV